MKKQKQREALNKDIEKYLNEGGKIIQLEPPVYLRHNRAQINYLASIKISKERLC